MNLMAEFGFFLFFNTRQQKSFLKKFEFPAKHI